MCGIVGQFAFDPNRQVALATVQQMCDQIVHRGPDDEGTFTCGPVGLGMRRLSIIDLAGGHQPMRSSNGKLTIVFNGEIYNHLDVRRMLMARGYVFATSSDTECILHAYDAFGVECLQHLNGMFAFAIWDAGQRRLFVARDRVGIKPLYLYQNAAGISFASEIKSLLASSDVPRQLDHEALHYFLRYGYVSAPATLLRDVRQLPPAHYLLVNANGITLHRYWSLENACTTGLDAGNVKDRAEHVYELLHTAVRRQLVSDVPLGAFLSGGLDSSSIVHMMADAGGSSINTYAIGFAGVDAFHNELEDAKFVSEHYGTNHHEIVVRPDAVSLMPRLVHHLDQPIADSSFVVTYLVSELASETVKVILSGVGGDEVFGGYRRYLGPYLADRYSAVPAVIRRGVAAAMNLLPVDRGSPVKNYFRLGRSFIRAHGLPAYERYDQAVQMLDDSQVRALSPELPGAASALVAARRSYFHQVTDSDPLGQMMRLDVHTSVVDSLLQLTDKMSMATSLEARVPFLDHELVEEVARIPSAAKIRDGRLRIIQRQSMIRRLPDRVLQKRKRGFGCPVGAWFRTDLRALLRDALAPARLRQEGIFEPTRVQSLIGEHETLKEDHTDLLLALVTFQMWRDEWKVT